MRISQHQFIVYNWILVLLLIYRTSYAAAQEMTVEEIKEYHRSKQAARRAGEASAVEVPEEERIARAKLEERRKHKEKVKSGEVLTDSQIRELNRELKRKERSQKRQGGLVSGDDALQNRERDIFNDKSLTTEERNRLRSEVREEERKRGIDERNEKRELEKKQRNRKRQHLTQERSIRISSEKYERYDRKLKRSEDFRRNTGDEEDKEKENPDEEYPDEEYSVDGEYPDDEEYNDSYREEKEKPKPKIPPTKSQLALEKAIERHNKNMGITKDKDSTSKKDKYGIPGSSSQSKSEIARQNALNKIDDQNKRKADMFQGEGDEL